MPRDVITTMSYYTRIIRMRWIFASGPGAYIQCPYIMIIIVHRRIVIHRRKRYIGKSRNASARAGGHPYDAGRYAYKYV